MSKANEYARQKGLTQFSVYQGQWNAAARDFERDIIPMCEAEGMALAPFGALGSGLFKTPEDYEKTKGEGRKMAVPNEKSKAISVVLDKLAKEKGALITSIALAYVMHKAPYVFPIVGGRKVEHLKSNIEALGIELTDEEIDEIEVALPFDVGFPLKMMFEYPGQKYSSRLTSQNIPLVVNAAHLDDVRKVKPPRPHKD